MGEKIVGKQDLSRIRGARGISGGIREIREEDGVYSGDGGQAGSAGRLGGRQGLWKGLVDQGVGHTGFAWGC